MPEAVLAPAAPAASVTPTPAAETAPVIPEGADAQKTGEGIDPTKPDGEKPTETAEDRAKRGINALERKLSRANRERAELRAKAELLERQLQEFKPKSAPDGGEPKLEDYSSIEEWGQANREYAKQQATKELTARQQTEASARENAELTASWETKAARADGKYDDFDEVVGDLKPTNALTAAIMEAENGEDIAYYLGKNPKEALRIAALNTRSQVREIGKLEAKLLAEPVKPKTPSSAPEPIKPVSSSAAPVVKKLIDTSYDEFVKRRKAHIARGR